MAKPPPKLYRIGEVMEHSGLSRQTVHNYTMLGLIQAAERTAAGHRLYRDEVFDRLERVKALRKDHTLLEIKRILEVEGEAPRRQEPAPRA